jgi:RimJ/RimL family protein N-acetyltransferase
VRQPVLVDEVVRLRAWLSTDAEQVYLACQDPDIQHFTQVPVPYLREHADFFVAQGPRQWALGETFGLAVTDVRTGAVLGACGLVSVDRDGRQAGAGYWVAPWARSRGVARRALELVTGWALGEGGLRRVYLEVEDANRASTAVALAAGFTRAEVPVQQVELKGTTRSFVTYERVATATKIDT